MPVKEKTDTIDAEKYFVGKSGKRHTAMVENQSNEFKSPLGRILRRPSLIDPSKLMYRKVSDDPLDTGGEDATIVDCAQEDYDESLRRNDAEAMRVYKPLPDPNFPVQSLERGAPVSIPVENHIL